MKTLVVVISRACIIKTVHHDMLSKQSSSSPKWLDEQDIPGVVRSCFYFSDFVLEASYGN